MKSVVEVKAAFFDRKAVVDAVGAGNAKALARGGAMVRTTARRSMRPGSKRIARKILEIRTELARHPHRETQQRELEQELIGLYRQASSAPGSPPKTWTRRLKDNTFFSYDPGTKSVVIGPAKLSGVKEPHQPGILEAGGDGRKPRPYMQPALQTHADQLAELFRNCIG